jgi:hypothetical protein
VNKEHGSSQGCGTAGEALATCRWKTYSVTVPDFPPVLYAAPTPAKARRRAFDDYQNYSPCSFRHFLSLRVSVRVAAPPAAPDDGYDYIRRQYGFAGRIGSRIRLKNEGPKFNGREGTVVYPGRSTAHVRCVLDGESYVSSVHPANVEVLQPDAPVDDGASSAPLRRALCEPETPTQAGGRSHE